jgi:hypothetical protein
MAEPRREGHLSAEHNGSFAVGPGTGWDPLAALELAGDGPAASARRCPDCGYLTTAIGHQVTCHD